MAKKPEVTTFLQAYGKEVNVADLIKRAKAAYVEDGHSEKEISDVKLYLKHEDIAAYYVINGTFAGRIAMF